MRTANIATAKNQFSRLIDRVKQGETIIITDRDRPVARLQPLGDAELPVAALHAAGLLSPPLGALDVEAFLGAARSSLPVDQSLTAAIEAEREEGR